MEIKKGDKVRVSEDAPKMYFRGWDTIFKSNDCNVLDVEDDNAAIAYGPYIKAVPTKYLVKVDAEAFRLADVVSDAGLHQDNYLNEDKKEAESKVGDKVVVHYPSGDRIGHILEIMLDGTYDIDYGGGCTGHNITRSQIEPYVAPTIKVGDRVQIKHCKAVCLRDLPDCCKHLPFEIVKINDGMAIAEGYGRCIYLPLSYYELIEPTEQTAEEKSNHTIKIPVEVDLTDSYWDAYAADLAKELAIKMVNRLDNPQDVAPYAVDIAKDIVKRLKAKQ